MSDKIIGIPFKDIKNYLDEKTIDCFLTLLKEQQKIIENKISQFRKIEKGFYACLYFRGLRRESRNYYKILFDYIKNNNLEIIGSSIEREVVNQFISEDKTYHLTEIQIPIKKSLSLQ